MTMSDPLADMLTRIRNGIRVGHLSVLVPASRLKREVCRVLAEEGYIESYEVIEDSKQGQLKVMLKYLPDRTPVLQGLRRVSRPSLRVYVGRDAIAPVRSGLGISILSTPKGVLTGKQARTARVGGEVLCEVW